MEKNYVITEADIRNTLQFQEYGVKPGDELDSEGTLIRKYSEYQEPQELGEEITEADIKVNPWMQEGGVEPGDRYVEGKEVIKTKSADSWEQFKYHYKKAGGMLGYLKDIGTIYTGMDFYYDTTLKSAEEKYGVGFNEASPEERRQMIYRTRERQIMEEFGSTFKPKPTSFAGMAGSFVGEMADPTTFIPFVGGVKGAFATGGALGGAYSAAQDIAEKGEVDPGKMAVSAGIGAVVPGTLVFGGKKLADRAARKNMVKVQQAVNNELANLRKTGPWSTIDVESVTRIAKETGVSERQLNKALEKSNMTLENVADFAVPQDSATKAISQDSFMSRLIIPGLDKFMGVLSTQLENVAPLTATKLRRHEFDLGQDTLRAMDIIRPFQANLKSMGDGPLKAQLAKELSNADRNGFARAESIMEQVDPSMVKNFEEVKKLLESYRPILEDQFGEDVFKGIINFFPRRVDDLSGLRKTLDSDNPKHFAPFNEALEDYAKEKRFKSTNDIPEVERVSIINKTLNGPTPLLEKPGPRVAQNRYLEVTNELLPYYAAPEVALERYVRNVVNTIKTNEFIGKKNLQKKEGFEGVDLEDSIGNFISRDMTSRNLKFEDQQKVKDLLRARFVDGETPMGKLASTIKEAGYMYTIANPVSALVQLTDSAITAALKGTFNTFTSLVLPKKVKLTDIMEAQISKEFSDPSSLANALQKTFKYSLFQAVDRLGKETLINASLKFNSKMARKNPSRFKERWGNTFPDNIETVMDDISNKRVTEDVKFLLFNELSGQQPISFSELPPGALDPKLRLLYMLKSFTLKQMDVVRREIVQDYKKGNKGRAALTAFKLGAYLSTTGLAVNQVKSILSGEELLEPEEIPTEALWSILSVYGLNKYVTDKYLKRGEYGEAIGSTVLPPFTILNNIGQGLYDLTDEDAERQRIYKALPVIGNLAYTWFGGGAEKALERQERERNAE